MPRTDDVLEVFAKDERQARAAPVAAEAFSYERLRIDGDYAAVRVPREHADPVVTAGVGSHAYGALTRNPGDSLVYRAEIKGARSPDEALAIVAEHPHATCAFSDPQLVPTALCAGDPGLGDVARVAELLGAADLHAHGLDGKGVPIGIVDTGFNFAFLNAGERAHTLDQNGSLAPTGAGIGAGGQVEGSHGTLVAYMVGVAAPNATLLDLSAMASKRKGGSEMDGYLSDALAAFGHARDHVGDLGEPGRGLVLNNSWMMPKQSWDFPLGSEGNYSDDPEHPFTIVVEELASAGADIVFAAGNCGEECPDDRCAFNERPLCGAASHASVTCVAAVDIDGQRLGYSTIGPGRIECEKPDLAAYAQFDGYSQRPVCTGTSVACALVSGVVAAVRTHYDAAAVPPDRLRDLLRETARPGHGHDPGIGWGVIDPQALMARLRA